MKKVVKSWKVYGVEGHRQRESFHPSCTYDFSKGDDIRIIMVGNEDKTHTNEYSILTIIRNTEEECIAEMQGQIDDGIFENSRVGKIVEL